MLKTITILSCFIMLSCQSEHNNQIKSIGGNNAYQDEIELKEDSQIEVPLSTQAPPPPIQEEFTLSKGSKIIKNGNMVLNVTNLQKSKIKIDSILEGQKGYYENEQYTSYGNRINYALRLRVPNSNFTTLVKLLEKGIGEIISKTVSTKDVTGEYVDLNIRLDNNLQYLKQYQVVLKKAKTIKEILEVKERIRRIEEEIDSKKGRLKYLDDKVNYSTLNLEISQSISSDQNKGPSLGGRIYDAFKNGIEFFISFIIVLINLWPFLILALILFFGRKRILNIFKRKNK